MKNLKAFILLILIVFTSCSKEKKDAQQDELKLLTGKPWKPALTDKNIASNPAGKNTYYPAQTCELNETYNFSEDSLLIVKPGSVTCTFNEQDRILRYKLDITGKRIKIGGTTYQLAELSATQLKYYVALASVTGYSNMVFIYQH